MALLCCFETNIFRQLLQNVLQTPLEMASDSILDKLEKRLDQWESKFVDHNSMISVVSRLTEINSNKDKMQQQTIERMMSTIDGNADRADSIMNRAVDSIDKCMDRKEKLEDMLETERIKYEDTLLAERKEHNRVVGTLLGKLARMEGKDKLGIHLMNQVHKRENEIKQKYSIPTFGHQTIQAGNASQEIGFEMQRYLN